MLDTIVRYLHDSLIPFRLASYPSMEHLPRAAHPTPKHGIVIESQVVLAAGKLVIACFPAHEQLDLAALTNELGAPVVEATVDDLPEGLKRYEGPPPPLGQLFGLSVVIDEEIPRHAIIVFQPFGESDFFEVPYDDYALQEQPRVASIARAGELPPAEQREEGASAR